MVPVKEQSPPLLTLVLQHLHHRSAETGGASEELLAFAAFLHGNVLERAARLREMGGRASERMLQRRNYQDVAVLGYSVYDGSANPLVREAFGMGVTWMKGRTFFHPTQALGFEVDGIAQLGVAIGLLRGASSPADVDWMTEVLRQAEEHVRRDSWQLSMNRAARAVLSARGIQADVVRQLAPDMACALASVGAIHVSKEVESAARYLVLTTVQEELPPERALVQLAALEWLLRKAANAIPEAGDTDAVIKLLKSVPHALKRWPWEAAPRTTRGQVSAQRWDIQNEYHVQSLLWAILAPVFPDLEDEEYLTSRGYKHPRADLALPSLGLIVEAKFLLEGSQSSLAGVIEEISADTGLYLSPPSEFSAIIAFVWDHSRSSQHHTELRDGLRSLTGVRDAVVVSRPGGWDVESGGSRPPRKRAHK